MRHGSYEHKLSLEIMLAMRSKLDVKNRLVTRNKLDRDINYDGWEFTYGVVHAQLWKSELLDMDYHHLNSYCGGLRTERHFGVLVASGARAFHDRQIRT
jgi:hypothetical protein